MQQTTYFYCLPLSFHRFFKLSVIFGSITRYDDNNVSVKKFWFNVSLKNFLDDIFADNRYQLRRSGQLILWFHKITGLNRKIRDIQGASEINLANTQTVTVKKIFHCIVKSCLNARLKLVCNYRKFIFSQAPNWTILMIANQ